MYISYAHSKDEVEELFKDGDIDASLIHGIMKPALSGETGPGTIEMLEYEISLLRGVLAVLLLKLLERDLLKVTEITEILSP